MTDDADTIRSAPMICSGWTALSWRLDKIYAKGELEKTNPHFTKAVESQFGRCQFGHLLRVQLHFSDHQCDSAIR